MSITFKNIALCLLSILLTLGGVWYFSDNSANSTSQQLETQNYFDEQMMLYKEQIAKAKEQAERMEKQLEISEKNLKRYDALLGRWEKQTDQVDILLKKISDK